jgi:hypothetical protein
VAYENLTEDEVIVWLKNTLGAEAIAEFESQILAKISANQQPATKVLTDRIPPWMV